MTVASCWVGRTGRRTVPPPAGPPPGLARPGVDIFAFAGATEPTNERTDGRTVRRDAPADRRTCFVARQRSRARDRHINCADNETAVAAVGDDAWNGRLPGTNALPLTHAADAVLTTLTSIMSNSLQRDSSDS